MKVEVKILNKKFYKKGYISKGNEDLEEYYTNLPRYATQGSAGIDLVCTKDVRIYPGETVMLPTGLAVWIGSSGVESVCDPWGETRFGYLEIAGFVLPRSGLGHEKGLVLGNTVGLIDEDYQGELKVSCHNRNTVRNMPIYDQTPIKISSGDRFAQLVIMPIIKAKWDVVEEFSSSTDRGQGGFGSTSNA